MSRYILPVFILFILALAMIKRIPVYDSFCTGAKESLKLVVSVFPYICAMLIVVELFRASGLADIFEKACRPLFVALGIPPELTELIVVRPLSGNGSIAILERLYAEHGADSYIARCASVIVGASETVFYIAAVYFSTTTVKKLRYAIPVALFSSFAGVIVSCLLCRLM